jgi:hypothetical protein
MIAFLRDADPDGSRSMRIFVELVPKLTAENADRLASYLPFPTKEAIPPLLNDFARLAAEPTNGTNVTSLLGKGCVALGQVLIDPSISTTLGRNPKLLRSSPVPENEQRCLVSSISSLANALLPLLTSSQEGDQQRALSLISSAMPLIDSDRKNALFLKVKELATQSGGQIRSEAIAAISLFSDRRTEAHTILLGILKSSLQQKRDADTDAIISATCQSAATLNTPKELNRYSPLVLEAIKRGVVLPGVMTLASKIDSIEAPLVALLSPANVEKPSCQAL